ncbi:MAG TPA: radical SAM protein [Thermoanaerobaculaceae bacterium]|nr:radical SAM protein [Thermoanaerobaculaceae bacterium]
MGQAKRITFVHPQGENWIAGTKDIVRIANVMPPHGLLMLAAVAERAGFPATILDFFAHPLPEDQAVQAVLATQPDAIGFSATTAGFMGGYRLAVRLKQARPDVPILFGGPHPTSLWSRLLREFHALDIIVVGEGEATLLELLQADLVPSPDIAGLAYRGPEGESVFTGPRRPLSDLDLLPYPAYEKLTGCPAAYTLPIFNYPRSPATTFITSRGCPYSCSYCDRSVFGSSFRAHSAEYLVDHLAFLGSRYGIRHVNIYDDNFTLQKPRVEEFVEKLRSRNLGITFNCIGRPNHLDSDLIRTLKRGGCWMINLGVESGDQDLISTHRTRSDLEEVAETVHRLREAGIRAKGLFMIGIPGETEESIAHTGAYALRHPFSDVNLTKFTPFPGSPIYHTILEHGEFDEDWEKMNCANFVFIPRGFTRERLEELYLRFYRAFYKRPAGVLNFVSMLWKSPESWRRVLGNAGAFAGAARQMKLRATPGASSTPRPGASTAAR